MGLHPCPCFVSLRLGLPVRGKRLVLGQRPFLAAAAGRNCLYRFRPAAPRRIARGRQTAAPPLCGVLLWGVGRDSRDWGGCLRCGTCGQGGTCFRLSCRGCWWPLRQVGAVVVDRGRSRRPSLDRQFRSVSVAETSGSNPRQPPRKRHLRAGSKGATAAASGSPGSMGKLRAVNVAPFEPILPSVGWQ